MSGDPTATEVPETVGDGPVVVPEVVYWIVAGFVAVGGFALALGGSAILWAVDEDFVAEAIAEAVAEEQIPTDVLTQAETSEVAATTVAWLGGGLVATGLAVALVAVILVVARHRSRSVDGRVGERAGLLSAALLGAVATGVLSFVPASPVLGGAVAAYVHRPGDAGPTATGAVSGLLAALPVVAILVFLLIGVGLGLSAVGGGGLGVVVALAVGIGAVGTLLYFVGLSAIGGFLADAIADDG